MSEFEDRLNKALQRGAQRRENEKVAAANKQKSSDELRRLHTQYRLDLSDHIEKVINKLVDTFPGFRYETLFGEKGWGAACWRDDLRLVDGQSRSHYSRLEMTIRPISEYMVLELRAKGTVANRELLSKTHFESLGDADEDAYRHLIDTWAVQFAEQYAALLS